MGNSRGRCGSVERRRAHSGNFRVESGTQGARRARFAVQKGHAPGGAGLMSAENTAGKQRGRPFQKGQSGNPDGRPKGSRNATTIALETLLDGQATALTQKAIDVALTGDMPALRLCLDRILPPRKDSPVAFDLPEMKTLNDTVPAMGALVKAVGQGDLTPTEAGELTKMVQAFAKIIETAELEERVRKLEEAIDK